MALSAAGQDTKTAGCAEIIWQVEHDVWLYHKTRTVAGDVLAQIVSTWKASSMLRSASRSAVCPKIVMFNFVIFGWILSHAQYLCVCALYVLHDVQNF